MGPGGKQPTRLGRTPRSRRPLPDEIPHLIGDAGLIFPTGDAMALADRLRQIRDDKTLREALVRRGTARVHAHFTQARIADATVATYRELLGTPASGSN